MKYEAWSGYLLNRAELPLGKGISYDRDSRENRDSNERENSDSELRMILIIVDSDDDS